MKLTSVLLMICLFCASLATARFAYAYGLYVKWDEQMNPGGSCFKDLEVQEDTRMISFTSAVITFKHGFNTHPCCEHYEQGAQSKTVSLSNARLIRFRKDAQPGIGQPPVEDKSFPLGTCNQFSEPLTSKLFSTPVGAFNNWPADIYQDAQDNEPDHYLFGIEFKCHMTHNCAGTAGEHCLCEPGTHYIEAMFRIQYANSAHCNRFVSFSFSCGVTVTPPANMVTMTAYNDINTDVEAWCSPVITNILVDIYGTCNNQCLNHYHSIDRYYEIEWMTPPEVDFEQPDSLDWESFMRIEDCFGFESFSEKRRQSYTFIASWSLFGEVYVKQIYARTPKWEFINEE